MNKKLTAEQLNSISKEGLIRLFEEMQQNLEAERKQNQELTKAVNALQESISVMTQAKYGRKTEKASAIPGQYVIDFENTTRRIIGVFTKASRNDK